MSTLDVCNFAKVRLRAPRVENHKTRMNICGSERTLLHHTWELTVTRLILLDRRSRTIAQCRVARDGPNGFC